MVESGHEAKPSRPIVYVCGVESGAGGWTGYFSNPPGYPTNVVDLYDVSQQSWDQATLSQPRSNLAAASAGNIIAVCGGRNTSKTYSDQCDLFNVATKTWSVTKLPSGPRAYLAAAAAGTKIFFGGPFCILVR
jgi:hypothetical protein